MLDGPIAFLAEHLDRRFRWDRLWWPLGILTLVGLRTRLRERNLFHPGPTTAAGDDAGGGPEPPRLGRTYDGSYTHPLHPRMGAAGTRFARNTPVVVEPDVATSTPDPAEVSSKLLARDGLRPAESLNLLAAAWLQFEVHDWFAHRVGDAPGPPLGLSPLTPDPSYPGSAPVFLSDQTHWWDASQLYGASAQFAGEVRTAESHKTGKVKVGDELLNVISSYLVERPAAAGGAAGPGPGATNPVPNLWTGLALFHVAFAHEHNAICDRLRLANGWDDQGDRLYDGARLVNAAVMAKIHTVEWTPALLAHPTTVRAIRSTWWGLLGERIHRKFGRIGAGELLSGIPGSRLDDEVPYAITEDFVAVYRMHQLIPDEIAFYRADDGAPVADLPALEFEELTATAANPARAKDRLNALGVENAWYSLGIAYPGALTLHNNPDFKPLVPGSGDGRRLDLGAVDILRTRECGVPRYNAFRLSMGLPPAATFEELTCGDETLAREIEAVYGDVDRVDLNVGLLADYKPEQFAISDTAFRVFLLMAARRLRSDPFFTVNYTKEVYTKAGIEWIENATMTGILRRHYPQLEPALRCVENPFRPWPRSLRRPPRPTAPGA